MAVSRLFYQSILWRGVVFLSSFVLNVLIARHFQAAVSGQIFYIINLYAFIILIASLSLESAMGYYVSRNEIAIAKLINFTFVWTLLIAVGIFIYMLLRQSAVPGGIIAITFICGNLLSNYCAGICYAKKNFFLPNAINIAINLSLVILLLLMEVIQTKIISDRVFLVILFSSFLLQGIASLFAVALTYVSGWRLSFPIANEFKKLFRFAILAFAANLITFLLYRIDYWFVKEYCSSEDLGNYIQVSKLVQLFFILPGMLAGAVFPLTAGGQQNYINSILATISRIICVFYFCCCLFLIMTGYWLFPFLFGHSFNNMYTPFLLYIPGILALSTLYTLTAYYAGKNKISVNITGALIALIFMVAGDLFFIPKYGINAAAAVSSGGYIIYHIYVLNTFLNEYGGSAISFFKFKLSDIHKIKSSLLLSK
jgi:O-antigen/teichoic acid export membrane protein